MNENKKCYETVWDENDDLSYVMDAVLNAPGFKKDCLANPDCNWILLIGDEMLADGITALAPLEQEILKLFFIDGLALIDISSKLNISIELVCGHIKSMKVRLRCYV